MVAATDDAAPAPPRVLIVDDMMADRFALRQVLAPLHAETCEAGNGVEALERIAQEKPDLVLLDIGMPVMDGREVLARLRADGVLRELPVLIISGLEDVSSVAGCLEAGAADYITKPFDKTVLTARVSACLERKRLRDREQRMLAELVEERERSERLLLNVLPKSIAARLKGGETTIADAVEQATVVYVELTDVAKFSAEHASSDVVALLNDVYSGFDTIAAHHGVDKVKTIGDVYFAAAGVLEPNPGHAAAVADFALEVQREGARLCGSADTDIGLRIGIDSGPVVAGVVGRSRFTFDVFGDAVKAASFLALYGMPGGIQISGGTRALLGERYLLQDRGAYYVEGYGELATFLLIGKQ